MSYLKALGNLPPMYMKGPTRGATAIAPTREDVPAGPSVSYSMFPTNVRVGDPVTITGPFSGKAGHQIRVRFTGSQWLYPSMQTPVTGSVLVPASAQNGVCEIEVNGKRVWGGNCIVDRSNVELSQQGYEAVGQAKTPTYATVAEVLEQKNGSGWRLLGWTALRAALILPGFLLMDVPPRKAVLGSLASSVMITSLALCWIHREAHAG